MLISVIVPVYKVEMYLTNCIESVLRQTFKEFELILVDDGSPDNCGKICEEYALRDSRIKVIHQQNAGLSAARNSGMAIARGDYFTFVDSDDFIFPHYLEKLLQLCQNNNADMSVCSMIRCKPEDSIENTTENILEKNIEVFTSDKMKIFFTTKKINTTAWGKLYKRYIFNEVKYPVGKYNEDIFVTYKIVHFSNKIVVCNYPGYVYRINEKSIVNESFSLKKMHSIEACLERAKFMELYYPELKRYALREIIYYCNQILFSMAKSNMLDEEVVIELQGLYRKYLWYYLFDKTALMGKIYALISFVDVKVTYALTKLLNRNK